VVMFGEGEMGISILTLIEYEVVNFLDIWARLTVLGIEPTTLGVALAEWS